MLNPRVQILIGSNRATGLLALPFANQCKINLSLKEMTSTCTISLAKKINIRNSQYNSSRALQDVVRGGQRVRVYARYDQESTDENFKRLEFAGWVRNINPQVPMEIECEDEMYILKRHEVAPKVFKGGKVSDVVKYIVQDIVVQGHAGHYVLDVLDSALGGAFAITRDENTAAKVLAKIEEVYGLKSNFRFKEVEGQVQNILMVGTQYMSTQGGAAVRYVLNRNVITNSLSYTRASDKQIRVRVSSRQADGKAITAKFRGDNEGDTKELQIPGLTQAQVEEYAKRLYEESKVDSFEGSITTFGLPVISPGMLAYVQAPDYEINETTNYVDEVQTSIGVEGYRREITLGPRLSQNNQLTLIAQ